MSATAPQPSSDVPDGFRPVRIAGQFIAHNGPLFARIEGDHRVQLGFRVAPRHTNSMGMCHGGMLATFADMLVPCAAMYRPGLERRFFLMAYARRSCSYRRVTGMVLKKCGALLERRFGTSA